MLPELDTQSAILQMMNRFQPFIQQRWKKAALEMKRKLAKYPSLQEFAQFVQEIAAELNDPVYGKVDTRQMAKKQSFQINSARSSSFQSEPSQETSNVSKSSESPSPSTTDQSRKWQESPCVLCGLRHRLWNCDQFKEKKPEERLKIVVEHKLCENCLLDYHAVADCRKKSVCSVPGCGKEGQEL